MDVKTINFVLSIGGKQKKRTFHICAVFTFAIHIGKLRVRNAKQLSVIL
jgi:hypothetical protein